MGDGRLETTFFLKKSSKKLLLADLARAIAAVAAPEWCGTASDLLAALPVALRPASAAVLASLLRAGQVELAAAGLTMTAKRKPKTGARLIRLAVVQIAASNGAEIAQPQPAGRPPCRRRAINAARLVAARANLGQ